ncbi:nuclear pore complex protein Nup98-Nup96 [Ixodes scapularis]
MAEASDICDLLSQDTNKREELLKPTNPAAQQALLSSQYKVSPLPSTKVRPKAIVGPRTETSFLFHGLDDEAEDSAADAMFVPRQSIKKLVIKPKDTPDRLLGLVGSPPPTSSVVSSTPASKVGSATARAPLTVPVAERVTDVSSERVSSPPTVSQKLNFDEVASSKGVSVVSPMSDLPKSNLQSLDDTVSSLGSSSPRRVLSFSPNPSDDSTASHLDAAAPPDPSRPPHPAGIVLTRPGYFTVPSLEELAKLTGADGRCVVDGFTVAREGYGNAFFPGRTDVTGLNLDEIVHFRRREIIIYPEDDDKPPVGEGLNRKAQVTLDCVWPNSKTTHEPITDPEKLKLLGYQEKLERATAKIGGRFLEYRPETGSWVFEVKHFSKYGLEDSDNEVDEAALAERPQQALPPPDRVVKPVEMPGEKHQQQMGTVAPAATAAGTVTFLSRFEPGAGYVPEDDEMEDLERSFPGRSDKYDDGSGLSFEPTPPATQRLAEVLGVSTESVQGMKASFFHADMGDMDDEDIELSFSHPRLKRALVSNREVRSPIPKHPEGPRPEPAAAPRLRRFSGQRPRPPSPDPLASRVLLPSSSATSASREATAMLDVPPMPLVLVEPVPLVQSFMYESQHLLGDIACTMGYRFRCGWGPRWSLLHLGSPLNGTSDNDTSQRPALGFLSGTQFSAGSTAYVVSLERVAVSHEVPASDDVQKDPEKLKLLGYQEKLERATAKIGGRFLEYRPETGSWVFEVKHFSKYGLEDSDNEVDEAALAERPQQALPPPDRVVKPVEMPGEKHQQQMGTVAPAATAAGTVTFLSRFEPGAGYVPEDDEMEDLERSFPGRSDKYDDGSGLSFEPTPPATQRLAEVLGVSTESVQGMKASFFHADMGDMDDEDIELSFSHPRLKRALVSNREVRSPIPKHPEGPRPEPAAAPRLRRFSGQRPRPPSPDPLASRVLLPSSSATSASREATAMLDVPPMPLVLVEPVPLVQSFMYESQHLLGDIACTMGYRFRCGWGPRWSLLHLGSPLNGTSDNDTSQRPALGFLSGTQFSAGSTAYVVSLERVAVSHEVPASDDVQKRNLTAMLEVQLAHSLSSVEAGSPVFVPKPGVEALHALNDLVSRLFAEMEPSHADRPMMQQLHRILGLCVALWGKTPGCNPDEDDTRTYAYMKARKEAFSDWLVQTTKQTVDSEVTDAQQREGGYLKAVMSHLSGHDVSKACSMAWRMRDYRLGMLVAQGGYSLLTRGMLQKQLDHWRKFKHDRHIEDERLRVYALLAGLMIWPSSEKTINCCADLDWKRALAMHLWYHCSPTGSIHDAVAAYEAAFQDNGAQHPYAVPPYPPYYDVFEEPFSLDGERSDAPHDTCFHLLKLYCDRSQRLDRLLDPVTSVPSHLDYRISWLLHKQLLSFGYPDLPRPATIHTSFASQLEAVGMWPWAAFALLHLEDPASRHSAVSELLMRHVTGTRDGCDPTTALSEDESFLHERLHVPLPWIYRAKAIRAGAEDNFRDQAAFQIKGGMWSDAHQTVMQHLATDAVIDEDLAELRSLLEPLSEHSTDIHNWYKGGQVLLNYLYILDFMEKVRKHEMSPYDLERIRPTILSVCDCIGCLSCKTPRDM